MTTSCEHCGARLPVATSGTSRCPACRRGSSGARDEHSVLFSLASLAGGSTSTPTASATPLRSRADEGSGLIDIRAMHPALGGRAEPAPPRFASPAPALLPGTTMPVLHHATTPALPSQMPLYGLVAALMFGLASLTAFVLSEPPPSPPASPRHTIPAPVVVAHAHSEPEPAAEVHAPDQPAAVVEAPIVPAEPGEARPHRPSHRPATKPAPVVAKPPTAVAPVAQPATRDDDATMKCLLGGGSCEVGRPAAKPEPVAAPVVATSLPERLSDTDITAGTGPAKARAASSCARLAKGNERVRIKLSIAGPTGTVIRAAAEDDAGNPALAACCVVELESASFKPVQRAQMGALVTLKF